MAKIIDMQFMRYINLFEKLCNVSTTNCFTYNNNIVFAVPKNKISKAIGKTGANMKKMSSIFRKKVKVIEVPRDKTNESMKKFVSDVVSPIEFSKLEVEGDTAIISAGKQSKAGLIGRNRVRQQELEKILNLFFDVDKLRIA